MQQGKCTAFLGTLVSVFGIGAIAVPSPAAAQANLVTTLTQVTNPTSLAIAPDGRLFVSQINGQIAVIALDGLRVTATGTLFTIANWTPDPRYPPLPPSRGTFPSLAGQLVTGIAFGPNGDLFVSHSDGHRDGTADPNSGVVSRLFAPGYTTYVDIARDLPRSVHNDGPHAPNGLTFGPDGFLYLAVGGRTNAGVPSPPFFNQDESALSSAILRIHPNGMNALSVYATGLRNPYDLVWHSRGVLFATDNGANAGFGPAATGSNVPGTACPVDPVPLVTQPSELNVIVPGGHYGHPNQARGQCMFGSGTPPVSKLPGSVNGIAEYTSGRAPALLGNLFTADYVAGTVYRIQVPANLALPFGVSTYTTLANPIDVAVGSDGRIYVAEHGTGAIRVVLPAELLSAPGYSAVVDFTGDHRADIGDHHLPSGQFWIRQNNGNGTFVPPGGAASAVGATSAPPSTWQVLAADFTGDGVADYADRAIANGNIWIHENLRTGSFSTASWAIGNTRAGDWEVLAGRMNGDAFADLIEHNRFTGQFVIRLNSGQNTAFSDQRFPGFRSQVGPDWRVAIADFNGDGLDDVADYHIPSAQFWIHHNTGGFDFTPGFVGPRSCTANPAFTCVFGDYTGDGFADYADVQILTGDFFVHANDRAENFTGPGNDQGHGLYSHAFSVMGLPITIAP